MTPKEKYTKLIKKIEKLEKPIVFINAATHGDEKMGVAVNEKISKLKLEKGTVITNIANEKALKKGMRYIDQDLNRSAPGNPRGNYEEKLAYYLGKVSERVDVFVDIHSTKSALRNSLIVDRLNKKVKEFIKVINPKTVLVMKVTGKTVLMSKAKLGIAFEYGKDNDTKAIQGTFRDVKKILSHLGMLKKEKVSIKKTNVYLVKKKVIKKEGYKLLKSIKNLSLVRKGKTIAVSKTGKKIIAEQDFYPILFGQDNYEDIFGFVGEKEDLK